MGCGCAVRAGTPGCGTRHSWGSQDPASHPSQPQEKGSGMGWGGGSGMGWGEFNSVWIDQNLTLLGKSGHTKPLGWACRAKIQQGVHGAIPNPAPAVQGWGLGFADGPSWGWGVTVMFQGDSSVGRAWVWGAHPNSPSTTPGPTPRH